MPGCGMHSRPNLAEKYGIAAYSKQATTTTKQHVMCAKPCAMELFLGLLCFAVFLILGSFCRQIMETQRNHAHFSRRYRMVVYNGRILTRHVGLQK